MGAVAPLLADELRAHGDVMALEGDLSDPEATRSISAQIDAIGSLDILIDNMGIFEPKPFKDIGDEDWQKFFDINVMSTVRSSRHVFPKMLERDFGPVINMASEAGVRGLESKVHCSMTKGAQVVIGRGLANLTIGCAGDITVNSVLPGPTLTEGVKTWLKESAAVQGKSEEQFVKEFFQETEPTSLIQRFLLWDEIANVVTFLASPLSSAINGAAIRAEGGLIKSAV